MHRGLIEIAARSANESDVHAARVELWRALFDQAERAAAGTWDVMLLDVRDASEQRVLACLAKLDLPFRIPQRITEDEVPHLIEVGPTIVATIPCPDPCEGVGVDEDDPSYDAAIGACLHADVQARVQKLAEASRDSSLAAARSRWLAKSGFCALWSNHPTAPYESETKLLFGAPLPKPPQPTTALGVFARLFQRTKNAVYRSNGCFTWGSDDQLVEITLHGADVDDAVLELLDEVCASLRQITLEHTRITPAGVEKLKKLLPRVTINLPTSSNRSRAVALRG